MRNPLTHEPVMSAVAALLVAAGAMLKAFGVDLTDTQIAYAVEFAQAALVVAFLVRSQVTPKAHLSQPDPPAPVSPAPVVSVVPPPPVPAPDVNAG